jgi:hypothetical protein
MYGGRQIGRPIAGAPHNWRGALWQCCGSWSNCIMMGADLQLVLQQHDAIGVHVAY